MYESSAIHPYLNILPGTGLQDWSWGLCLTSVKSKVSVPLYFHNLEKITKQKEYFQNYVNRNVQGIITIEPHCISSEPEKVRKRKARACPILMFCHYMRYNIFRAENESTGMYECRKIFRGEEKCGRFGNGMPRFLNWASLSCNFLDIFSCHVCFCTKDTILWGFKLQTVTTLFLSGSKTCILSKTLCQKVKFCLKRAKHEFVD